MQVFHNLGIIETFYLLNPSNLIFFNGCTFCCDTSIVQAQKVPIPPKARGQAQTFAVPPIPNTLVGGQGCKHLALK